MNAPFENDSALMVRARLEDEAGSPSEVPLDLDCCRPRKTSQPDLASLRHSPSDDKIRTKAILISPFWERSGSLV